jgi:hypothetical protein
MGPNRRAQERERAAAVGLDNAFRLRCGCNQLDMVGRPNLNFRVSYFEQMRPGRRVKKRAWQRLECVMFTPAECRARSEQKLKQAECNPRHRRRLIGAAQAWLILADREERLEAVSNIQRKSPGKK